LNERVIPAILRQQAHFHRPRRQPGHHPLRNLHFRRNVSRGSHAVLDALAKNLICRKPLPGNPNSPVAPGFRNCHTNEGLSHLPTTGSHGGMSISAKAVGELVALLKLYSHSSSRSAEASVLRICSIAFRACCVFMLLNGVRRGRVLGGGGSATGTQRRPTDVCCVGGAAAPPYQVRFRLVSHSGTNFSGAGSNTRTRFGTPTELNIDAEI